MAKKKERLACLHLCDNAFSEMSRGDNGFRVCGICLGTTSFLNEFKKEIDKLLDDSDSSNKRITRNSSIEMNKCIFNPEAGLLNGCSTTILMNPFIKHNRNYGSLGSKQVWSPDLHCHLKRMTSFLFPRNDHVNQDSVIVPISVQITIHTNLEQRGRHVDKTSDWCCALACITLYGSAEITLELGKNI